MKSRELEVFFCQWKINETSLQLLCEIMFWGDRLSVSLSEDIPDAAFTD